jgi:diguanylate cyclase (GGDEF)-like protein
MSEVPNISTLEQLEQKMNELHARVSELEEDKRILIEENTHLSKALESVQKFAMEDMLTGAASRHYFLQRMKEHLSLLEHQPSDKRSGHHIKNLSVMFFDLDQFKSVNDTYGHDAGDRLLKAVATCLKDLTREEDTVCRWGGDEFVACFPDVDEKNSKFIADRIYNKLTDYLTSYLTEEKIDIPVTISFGIANYEQGMSIDELIKRADHAMYHVKKSGKDGYVSHGDINNL